MADRARSHSILVQVAVPISSASIRQKKIKEEILSIFYYIHYLLFAFCVNKAVCGNRPPQKLIEWEIAFIYCADEHWCVVLFHLISSHFIFHGYFFLWAILGDFWRVFFLLHLLLFQFQYYLISMVSGCLFASYHLTVFAFCLIPTQLFFFIFSE